MTPAAFGPQDLLQLALDIEARGREIYAGFEAAARDGQVKALWGRLKEQEGQHARLFEGLLRTAQLSLPEQGSSAEATPYLRALFAAGVFRGERLARVAAEGVRSDAEALELAMGMERDALLAYGALRERILGDSGRVLERILDEERRHLVELTELYGRLSDQFSAPPPDLPTGL